MRRYAKPAPAAAAGRLVLYKERLKDLDAALALLGLARQQADMPSDSAQDDIPPAEVFRLWDSTNTADDVEDSDDDLDDVSAEDVQGRLLPRSGGSRSMSIERPTISYLLAPDRDDIDRRLPEVDYKYHSIANRVQRVVATVASPDPEAWRVARSASDLGPRAKGLGHIDIRECVTRIARKESLERLPRLEARRDFYDLHVLVDWNVSVGVFSADVRQLQEALRGIIASSSYHVERLVQDGSRWLTGAGPVWSFARFRPSLRRTWYVVIAGGQKADPANLEPWNTLAGHLGKRHIVTLVWVGDQVKLSELTRLSWLHFRS